MNWSMILAQPLLYIGGLMLGVAVVLVFVDVPDKGVPWDKVAAWFGIIGGFAVGGAAAGWVGRTFASSANTVVTTGENVTARLLGVGVSAVIVVGLLLWAYSRVRGKGIGTKSKPKSLLLVAIFGIVGTIIATVLPAGVYSTADEFVGWVGSGLITLFNSI